MTKIEVQTTQRPHKSSGRLLNYVQVSIDGLTFETEAPTPDKARELAVKTARALGIAYKHA